MKIKAQSVAEKSSVIMTSLLYELCCDETDWVSMKFVMISIHQMTVYCQFEQEMLIKILVSVAFIANRWQRKLVLMDGISQAINSIIFKLFNNLPPIDIFNALLAGMSNFRGTIPTDSFYCKCWVALANQLKDIQQQPETQTIVAFAKEKMKEFNHDDIRSKLCNALANSLSNKKRAQNASTTNTSATDTANKTNKGSMSNTTKVTLPKSPLKAAGRLSQPISSSLQKTSETKPNTTSKQFASPRLTAQKSAATETSAEATATKTEDQQSARQNGTQSKQIMELRDRLTQLRKRWK